MSTVEPQGRLAAADITVGYGERTIISGLDVVIPDGSFTVILGPNACGKSTLLRTLSRLLAPTNGVVELDGRDVKSYGGKEFAREVGLLPQQSIAPDGISIIDLVSRGRFPYQTMFRQWTDDDQAAVDFALQVTRLTDLSLRPVEALSGGQRQRVWIAMALTPDTPILLLDEPTTYLDLAHQIEVLELCTTLHQRGITLVAVLHNLNQAARYASHIIAMRSGAIVAQASRPTSSPRRWSSRPSACGPASSTTRRPTRRWSSPSPPTPCSSTTSPATPPISEPESVRRSPRSNP